MSDPQPDVQQQPEPALLPGHDRRLRRRAVSAAPLAAHPHQLERLVPSPAGRRDACPRQPVLVQPFTGDPKHRQPSPHTPRFHDDAQLAQGVQRCPHRAPAPPRHLEGQPQRPSPPRHDLRRQHAEGLSAPTPRPQPPADKPRHGNAPRRPVPVDDRPTVHPPTARRTSGRRRSDTAARTRAPAQTLRPRPGSPDLTRTRL